tara:strand:- start:256 stop:3795 length:3540 start_codon:yes stop_codon:yes gene_type:complete
MSILTGDISRKSATNTLITPKTIEKDNKAPSSIGKPRDEKELETASSEGFNSFLEEINAGNVDLNNVQKGMSFMDPNKSNSLLNDINAGKINLKDLQYQTNAEDLTMLGKFDRIKYLKKLKEDGNIDARRYLSLKQNLDFTIEEAALLEAEETGRTIDPADFKKDPILMDKYGFIALDSELAETVIDLQNAGVDITSGADADIRVSIGRQSTDDQKILALEQLKKDGDILFYKPSKLGFIISVPGPDNTTNDILLDEIGFSGKDLLDLTSEVPGIAANIGATIAAVSKIPRLVSGGLLSLGGLAAISGISYFTGATASDVINRIFTNDQVMAIDQIFKDRGLEAAIAAGMDFAILAGVKLVKGAGQALIGPVANSGDETVKAYLKTIAANKEVLQYDQSGKLILDKDGNGVLGPVQLTPGLATQSMSIQRVEGIAEKIPGGAEILEAQKNIIEKQLLELEFRAKGVMPEIVDGKVIYPKQVKDPESVGISVSDFISRQLNDDLTKTSSLRTGFNLETDAALDSISGTLSSSGKVVTTKESSTSLETAILENKKQYMNTLKDKNFSLRELEGWKGDQTIRSTELQKIANKIEDTFPTSDGDTIFPKGPLKNLINDLKQLDEMTVETAISYKQILKDSISKETLPTKADDLINSVIKSLDNKINIKIKGMSSEVKKEYNNLIKFTSQNEGKYQSPIVRNILLGNENSGKILIKGIMEGKANVVDDLIKILGEDNPIIKDIKSSIFNEFLRKSRSSLDDNFTNPNSLWGQISELPEETQKFMFGNKEYSKVKNLLKMIGQERGVIDLKVLNGLKGPLSKKLQTIYQLEQKAEKDWKNKILKPFLKNEIDETEMNPAQFTRYFVRTGTTDEIIKTMNKLSPGLQADIRKRVIQDILESGRTGDPSLILKEFASGEVGAHKHLYKALYEIGGGSKDLAEKKLTTILGEETFKLLEDVAGIQAARRVTSDVAASAGGLISGSILNNLLNLKLGSALSIVKYRIAAKILSNPAGRAWLVSSKKIPAIGPKTVGISVASSEIIDLITEEFKNEPDLQKEAIELLKNNNKEYNTRAKEDKEFNMRLNESRKPLDQNINIPVDTASNIPVDTASNIPVDTASNIPSGSMLNNNANIAPPIGAGPKINTMAGGPSTMNRGQQLFGNNPREITFAAKGGIMNTMKATQRVL